MHLHYMMRILIFVFFFMFQCDSDMLENLKKWKIKNEEVVCVVRGVVFLT